MRSALASVPGIEESDIAIDLPGRTATVTLDDPKAPSTEALLSALDKTQFKATVRK